MAHKLFGVLALGLAILLMFPVIFGNLVLTGFGFALFLFLGLGGVALICI